MNIAKSSWIWCFFSKLKNFDFWNTAKLAWPRHPVVCVPTSDLFLLSTVVSFQVSATAHLLGKWRSFCVKKSDGCFLFCHDLPLVQCLKGRRHKKNEGTHHLPKNVKNAFCLENLALPVATNLYCFQLPPQQTSNKPTTLYHHKTYHFLLFSTPSTTERERWLK